MNILDQNEITFKINDKVSVLVNKTPDKPFGMWKAEWNGVIVELGTHFAKIWCPEKTDSNVGSIAESSEWVPYTSKMMKITKE